MSAQPRAFLSVFRWMKVAVSNRGRVDKGMIQGIRLRPSLDPANDVADEADQCNEADQ